MCVYVSVSWFSKFSKLKSYVMFLHVSHMSLLMSKTWKHNNHIVMWIKFFLCDNQALQELQEVFPAVDSALKATQYEPNWSTAWQTLGRAQLGLGEVLLVSYARFVESFDL